ncbi:serpin family protein [Cellulomonas gilvus]|uniref:Proteinase inhibitor I4 serpin n=1 Tax=Cellulomonas gilvus (strain ATCC 13127 / NRRL B-14078) TaxID=593907 RepID=F8A573_CELGA|nr:serpin family protein [Cellulomonas gilvus]AEI13317.1 proteinase inhibitor I4 serpin [Cellulomonas gilvus ATCC 13127]
MGTRRETIDRRRPRSTHRAHRGAAVAAVLLLAGCASSAAATGLQTGEGERERLALTDAAAVDDVVAATWELGMQALRSSDETGAAVVSPSSLVTALSMLAEGAKGAEEDPFADALGASGAARSDAVNALLASLERYAGPAATVGEDTLPPTPVVHTAQQVVVDDSDELVGGFLDRLQRSYGVGVEVTDLQTDEGLEPLSDWVREHSGGLVEKTAIQPDPYLLAVLQDAVTLAARWQTPLDGGTRDGEFASPDGTVPARMMTASDDFAVVHRDGWTALRLPFTDDLAMDVLLPPEGSTQADRPATADPELVAALSAALDDAEPGAADVTMPLLDLSTTTDLLPLAHERGLTAEVSDLVESGPVNLGQAKQQVRLEVGEQGARAAAVTELGIVYVSMPLESVRVDRPFLLTVRDGTSGWPLFLGAVEDPNA